MRHRFLLATLFIFIVFPLSAQMTDLPAQLQWGAEQRAPSRSRIAKVISAGEWGAFVLRYKSSSLFSKEQFWIEQYDRRFDLRGRYELQLPSDEVDLEDIISLDGQLYILFSRPFGDQTVSRVVARPLSPNGQVTDREILLAEINEEEKYRRRQFDLEFSRDSSLLLLYNQLPTQRGEVEKFTLRVFDDQFELLWSRDVSLPYQDADFNIIEYRVDIDGNVFVLGRLRDREEEGSTPRYMIFGYTREGQDEQEYRVALQDRHIKNLTFRLAGNGDLVVGGYQSVTPRSVTAGVFYARIDPVSKSSGGVALVEFPDEVRNSTTTDERFALRSFRPRDIIPRSDGGAVLIGEQFFNVPVSVSTYTGIRNETYFHYGDLLVMNIGPDGELDWARRIPKLQDTANDSGAFSSFAQATVSDRFYFIYNDNPQNFSPDIRRRANLESRRSVLALTELTRTGEVTTVPLFVNRDARVITRPRMCRQVGSRLILVYGEDGRRYRFGLLEME